MKSSNNTMKDYSQAFYHLLLMLKTQENFAFTRFSDGELDIMKNKYVCLAKDYYMSGDYRGRGIYTVEEQKEFIPSEHQFCREALLEAFKHNQDNYYKGICTSSDFHIQHGSSAFQWMIECHGGDHPNLTFSNLLINANYSKFVQEMIPVFAQRPIIYVVNEHAKIESLPFEVSKAFTIGSNCMINDFDLPEKISTYINENSIKDHIVLCSAASLSNFIIHKCFKENPNNTFLDIGSCLNPLLDLEGWKYTRGYLTAFWMQSNSPFGKQVDIWG